MIAFHLNDGADTVAGGAGGDGGKKDEKKKEDDKKDDAAEKVTLTKAELAAQVAKAVEKERTKHETTAAESKRKAEEESAKKQGEFEKLYESEKARVQALETADKQKDLALRGKDVDLRLRDYVADKHKDYLQAVKWIRPAVEFAADTADDELDKRIKSAVETYVKDNPRATKFGAPEHHTRNTAGGGEGSGKEKTSSNNEKVPTPAYMRR